MRNHFAAWLLNRNRVALRPAWVYKLFDTSDQMPPSQAPAPPPPGLPSLFLPHSYCLLLLPFCLCVCVCVCVCLACYSGKPLERAQLGCRPIGGHDLVFLILQGSKVDNKTGSPSWVLSPKAALVRQENQEGSGSR